ncbi:MAG TPA: alcohol dehydrogenase, partial [Candidatus Atribacteria bacterium]|nr:alcohol dehydrogenase [Candidatus Atribacteria bacterium]
IALAKSLGASRIIVSEIKEERLELARQFGADRYVNPKKEDLGEVLKEVTEGIGPTVVIIAAPAKKAQEEALLYAAPRARINLFGGLPGDDRLIQLDANLIHYREIFVHGTSGSTPLHNALALSLMASGRVNGKSFISKVVSLEELPQALEEANTGNLLKIVVKP